LIRILAIVIAITAAAFLPEAAVSAETAPRFFRVVDLNTAAAVPDLFPPLEEFAPPDTSRTVYSVYQHFKILMRFESFGSAAEYARKYADSAVVAEGLICGDDGAWPVLSSGRFAVFQGGRELGRFDVYGEAAEYAAYWERGEITGFAVVWHNYGTGGESELLSAPSIENFGDFAGAVAFAGGLKKGRPAVISASGKVLWEKTAHTGTIINGVSFTAQLPELPRGCEVTSLAMLLNHAGISVGKEALAEGVRKSPFKYDDPNNGFIGDMYSFKTHGLGVYHAPIAELAERYAPGAVIDATGLDFNDLLYYIDSGRPVWVITNSWFSRLPASEFITWKTPYGYINVTYREHSVLITGYDGKRIYFNDPLSAAGVSAPRSAFIAGWEQMGNQAVTLVP
jgi:uncharacterized protein YvpB